jgi:membrane protein DedA with SNARE-associated domain
VSEDDLDRALLIFQRYGDIIVFVGRLIPLIRSLISLPAGMNRMPLGRFLLFTTLGSGLWTAALAAIGVFMGENWTEMLIFVKQYEHVTLIMLAAAAIGFIILRVRERLARRADSDPCVGC